MKRLVIVLLVKAFVLGMVTLGFAQGTSYKLAPAKKIFDSTESNFQMGITALPKGYHATVTHEYTVNMTGPLRMRVRGSMAFTPDASDIQLWLQSGLGWAMKTGIDREVTVWVTNWNMIYVDGSGYQTPMCLSVEGTTHKFWENESGSMTVKVELLAYWWRTFDTSTPLSDQPPKQIGGPVNIGVRIVLSHLSK